MRVRTLCAGMMVWVATLSSLCAHELWVIASAAEADGAAVIEVSIGSGHYFPNSELAPRADMIRSLRWTGVDGDEIPLETVASGRERTASFTPGGRTEGSVKLILQHPRRPKPDVIATGLVTGPAPPAQGADQEIVLLQSPGDWQPDQPFAVEARRQGAAVAAKWTVVPERGATRWASSTPDQPAQLKLEPGQRHLVSATVDGVLLTITFVAGGKP